jgi:hypothetical protein
MSQSRTSKRRLLSSSAASFAAVLLMWPGAALSASESPFGPFLGSWRGSGDVTATDGHKERLTCRATYTPENGGEALTQSLVCASDSYRFDVELYVVAEGRTLHGHWEETTRKVAGNLTGRIGDGDFDGSVVGPTFTAQVAIRSNERRQAVSIRPSAGGITSVEIILTRQR